MDLKERFPVTLLGEATGGSPNSYTEIQTFEMPHSKIPFSYSVKYFQGTDDGAQTINPDISFSPSIEDFKMNRDIVLLYIASST